MILFAMLALVASGCADAPGRNEYLFFSPDGRTLAWIFHAQLRSAFNPYAVVRERYDVRWRSVDDPESTKSATVDEAGNLLFAGTLDLAPRVLFSPDSRRLAAAGERGLMVVELGAGQSRQLCRGDEFVTSFVWTGSDEIVYVTCTGIDLHTYQTYEATVRTVWRQNVAQGASRRKAVLRREVLEPGRGILIGHRKDISPDGKHAVLADLDSPPPPGLFRGRPATISFSLVGLDDGRERRIVADDYLGSWGVAWKPDASAVAVIFEDSLRTYRAVLFEPATGRTYDFSEAFTQAYEPPPEIAARGGRDLPLLSQMTWTADGEYLVLNGYGGRLVRPEPFAVVEIGRSFGSVFSSEDHDYLTEVVPTPVAGWVFGYGDDAEGVGPYVIDYRRMRYVRLTGGTRSGTFRELKGLFSEVEGKTRTTTSMMEPPFRVVVAPDGRRLATIGFVTDEIEIRKIDLSAP
jgi:hypothetical protein